MKFVIPKFLYMFNSFLSKISEKKYNVLIKKTNGKTSKRTEGAFKSVKYIGTKISTFSFLK